MTLTMTDNLAAAVAVNRDWLHYAEASLSRLIVSGVEFTCDDVRHGIPVGLEPHNPNVMGSLLAKARNDGHITRVYDTRSTRRTRNSSRVGVWRAAA
jgi:CO dehydrogenase/acetyl-CoA synthase alpha subunit